MTSKFLESDLLDSKIFAGRVLTMLGDLDAKLNGIADFLEERMFFPRDNAPESDSDESASDDARNDSDIYDGDDESE